MLLEVERRPITPRHLSRIRSGRFRRRYQPVLDAYQRLLELVTRLDRAAIRKSIEEFGIVSRDDPTILEVYSTFEVLRLLRERGWQLGRLGLFGGHLALEGLRGDEVISISYQHVPRGLSKGSKYRIAQTAHGIAPGALRPDLVIHWSAAGSARWVLVEVKGGAHAVEGYARAALYDLLAYRSAFDSVLAAAPTPYGFGIAWGADLLPDSRSEVLLCTPDRIGEALSACNL